MISQNFTTNINKIDFDLKQRFDKVTISEKPIFNKFYLEIISEAKFSLEKNKKCSAVSKVLVEKKFLQRDSINWSYSINPNDSNSQYIDRTSNIQNFAEDVYNTISKKQLSNEYLDFIQRDSIIIKESLDFDLASELTSEEIILKVLEKWGVNLVSVESKIEEGNNTDLNLIIIHEGLRLSQKFNLEDDLMNFSFVNWVNFGDNNININYKF